MFRWGWERLEGRVIDEKFVERKETGGKKKKHHYQVLDFMVELPGLDGQPTRLIIREKSFNLRLPLVGKTAPVLVNKQRTRAEFDLEDPRVGAAAQHARSKQARSERDKARKERGEARFREQLGADREGER